MRSKISFLFPLAAFMFLVLLMLNVSAQTAVIDEQNISRDKEKLAYSDTLTVTAPVVFVDAEPVTDGVVLEWKLCTDNKCEIPTRTVMTDTGNGTFSATIGPFPERDDMGDPYVDVGFTVEVTYVPTGGGDEQKIESAEITVYFDQSSAGTGNNGTTDDDDTDDDDDGDSSDSPMGFELAVLSLFAVLLLMMITGRRKQ
ncbi:hypothetical protein B6U90_01585 [Thermoplasmatales archaeon ex4484_6]|nr:MAG: hypothetical protein B6U90_01585 [Thermoplasmatales archaeon ex4484_6]